MDKKTFRPIWGFSLIEVLISIFLLSTLVLALLTEQWHITHLYNQVLKQQRLRLSLSSAKEKGLTLVELLVALSLSSLITLILVQQLIHSRMVYHKVSEKLEEELEFADLYSFIRDSIIHAGFTPCISVSKLQFSQGPIKSITSTAHSLSIRRMGDTFSEVSAIVNQQELALKGAVIFKRNHSVLICDCFHAEIHSISNSSHTRQGIKLFLKEPLVFTFTKPTYVGEWLDQTLYLENFDLKLGHEVLQSGLTNFLVSQTNSIINISLQRQEKTYAFSVRARMP